MGKFTSYSDEQLITLLKEDNDGAFTEIYHRYWKLLLSIAGNKLPSLMDAEEVVQNVFMDLWKRRQEISFSHSIKSFLAAATKYQVYTSMAKMSREKALDGAVEEIAITINEEIESRDLFDNLYNEAARLPEKSFLVYKLSRIEGLNNKEISNILGMPEKTIEGQLTRTLRHLRAAMHLVLSGIFLS